MLGVAKSTPSSHSYGVGVASAWRDVTEMLSELVCSLSLGGGCGNSGAAQFDRLGPPDGARAIGGNAAAGAAGSGVFGEGATQSSAEQFSEGIELLMRCWTETQPFDFKGRFHVFEDVEVFPKPLQKDFRPYMGSFSRFSMELAVKWGWNLLLAPFAATILFGGLDKAVMACEIRKGRESS